MDRDALLLHRIDPARNMARYYALAIEPTLFGDHAVIRRWGRLGTHGRQAIELHAEAALARAAFARLAAAKRRRGYVPAGEERPGEQGGPAAIPAPREGLFTVRMVPSAESSLI